MFSIVPNPFTGNSKREKEMQKAMDQHSRDRETREATNRAAWHSSNRVNEAQRGIGANGAGGANSGSKLSRMNNYQFEADDEDEDMENQIDDNLSMYISVHLHETLLTCSLQHNYTPWPRASTNSAVQSAPKSTPRMNTLLVSRARRTRSTTRLPGTVSSWSVSTREYAC